VGVCIVYGGRCPRNKKTGRYCTKRGGHGILASLSGALRSENCILGRSSGSLGVFGSWNLYSPYQSLYSLFSSEEDGKGFFCQRGCS